MGGKLPESLDTWKCHHFVSNLNISLIKYSTLGLKGVFYFFYYFLFFKRSVLMITLKKPSLSSGCQCYLDDSCPFLLIAFFSFFPLKSCRIFLLIFRILELQHCSLGMFPFLFIFLGTL